MKLLDLTGLYCRTVAINGAWRDYEEQCPELFRHYFRFWAKRSYPDVKIPVNMLLSRSARITRRLPQLLRKFNEKGFDTSDLCIVLFVGKNCTNGHAFRGESGWVVWIPVESYATDLLIDVFVTHEIAHALHYESSSKFYFTSKPEHRDFARLLLTEGIATYLTTVILGCTDDVALWGDFLTAKQISNWRVNCERSWSLINDIAVRKFRSNAPTELFQANDSKDVFKFRAGYLLGLELVKEVSSVENIAPNELVALSRKRFERLALNYLKTRS